MTWIVDIYTLMRVVDIYIIWTIYAKQKIKKTCNETHLVSGRVVFQFTNYNLLLVKTTRPKAG